MIRELFYRQLSDWGTGTNWAIRLLLLVNWTKRLMGSLSVLCAWFNFVEQRLGQRFWALVMLVMSTETQSKSVRRERAAGVHKGAEGAGGGICWHWKLKRGASVPFAFLLPIPSTWSSFLFLGIYKNWCYNFPASPFLPKVARGIGSLKTEIDSIRKI